MKLFEGQKVICVRDQWDILPDGLSKDGRPFPTTGIEYVIRSQYIDAHGLAIRLHWLFSPELKNGFEPGWSVYGRDGAPNFRPVIETDISEFTKMLAPAPKKFTRANA